MTGAALQETIMSVFESHHTVPLGAISTYRLVSLPGRVIEALVAWRNACATRRSLLALSDRQLSDIGVHRGQIPGIAEALAWR
jgi:uncharacterized protein YjiS (DUF1127 family)